MNTVLLISLEMNGANTDSEADIHRSGYLY